MRLLTGVHGAICAPAPAQDWAFQARSNDWSRGYPLSLHTPESTISAIDQTGGQPSLEPLREGPSLFAPATSAAPGPRIAAASAIVVAAIAVAVTLVLSAGPTAAHGPSRAPHARRTAPGPGGTTRAPGAALRSAPGGVRPRPPAWLLDRRRTGGSPELTLPFPVDSADRDTRPGEAPSLYADELPCSVGCRPYGAELGWPLAPFHRQHPIRAGLNELRPGSLHVAVDIQAPDAAPVYAVQPGLAHVLEGSGPNARVQVGNYVYWHINPSVHTGELVVPFVTVLGHVMDGYGHVAFSEVDAAGNYVNPLRPQGSVLAPFADHAAPVIGRPAVAAGGQVIVSAYSPQSFIRRTTYLTPVLAPAGLAYRLYDADHVPVTALEWAFRGTHLLPWSERSLIYAPGAHAPGYDCFPTRTVCVPHWVFRLAGGLAPPLPATLASGRYRLAVYAWDWADNKTAYDLTLTMTPKGWRPVGRFPKALFREPGYFSRGELLAPALGSGGLGPGGSHGGLGASPVGAPSSGGSPVTSRLK